MKNKTFNKVLIVGILIIITTFTIALLALLIQTFNIDSGMTAGIISGVLSMFGGMVGAFGAYLVATNQMQKQFEHEKKKEEKQKYEILEQSLKKLELLSEEAIEFVEFFNDEFSVPFDTEALRNIRLKFAEDDLQWIVNSLNNIDHGILMEDYGLDYLRFSRELHNAYIDVAGINFIPSHQIENNLKSLIATLLIRGENFKSLKKYLSGEIKYIQKQIESII